MKKKYHWKHSNNLVNRPQLDEIWLSARSGLIRNPGSVSLRCKANVRDFGGLVIGCIETDLCKSLLTLQRFFKDLTYLRLCPLQEGSNVKISYKKYENIILNIAYN